MRNRGAMAICAVAIAMAGHVSAETLPPDFVLSLLRFGIECQRSDKPRNVYLGDAERFALQVEKPVAPVSPDGVKPARERVTYRAFYRDMIEPEMNGDAIILRCRAEAKCIAVYKAGSIERTNTLRISSCSYRTATLVVGAAREFIRQGQP
jgi:hypothetical protein